MNILKKICLITGIAVVFIYAYRIIDNNNDLGIFDFSPFPFVVTGNSMSPTFLDGQRILVRGDIEPTVNSIVVFKTPKYINGSEYLVKRIVKIDNGNWWVEGDNKDHSLDSRTFGWISPSERSDIGITEPH